MESEPVARWVAARIRNLRLDRGWSAQRLADACAEAGFPSLTRGTIAKIESGVRKSISDEEINALAMAFDISTRELITPDPDWVDERINPFRIPNLGAKVPLRPWQVEEHSHFYVPVGNSAELFYEFVREMDSLDILRRDGQLLVVAGDTGCGKSALSNRCAHYVRYALRERAATGVVVDVRTRAVGWSADTIEERFAHVLWDIVAELDRQGAVRDKAHEVVRTYEGRPDAVYRQLPDLLAPGHVAIVLLPPTDLAREVIRYGAATCPNVLFVAEFTADTRTDDALAEVVEALERHAPPVVLRMTGLRPGDVRLFVEDRLNRNRMAGRFPRLTEETVDALETVFMSVAQMQSTLYETYEHWLRRASPADDADNIEFRDVVSLLLRRTQNG